MKKILDETQLYSQLARRGDPSAFYALFHDHIRSLYVLLRSRGKDHEGACADASKTLETMYQRFIKRPPVWRKPGKWFAAGCKLGKFDAGASGVAVSLADAEKYDKTVHSTLIRLYSERLDRGNDGKGNLRSERPFLPYIAALIAAGVLVAFLFFSEAVLSASLGRFTKEYKVSFPQIAESLWKMSGLIRGDEVDYLNGTATAPPDTAEPKSANE